MTSTKQPKLIRAEKTAKETSPNRRNFLRLGALGAAAVLAGSVMAGSNTGAAAQGNRQARRMRSLGTAHQSAEGREVRKAGALRSSGELGSPSTKGTRSLRKAVRAAPKSTQTAKSADGNRAARRLRRTVTPKSQKAMKVTAQ
jgi:hypothetical protein